MGTMLRKAELKVREKRANFKAAARQNTKIYREIHDLTVNLLELEKNLPLVQARLERMLIQLPKMTKRLEMLKNSQAAHRKRRETAQTKLDLAIKKFSLIKKLLEIEKELEGTEE